MKNTLLFFLTIVFAGELKAQEPAELETFVAATVQQYKIAGASVLIKQKGKVVLNKGYGYADLSHHVPASPNTTYFLVGPGMFILSACILQQVEKGNISLDDELSKFLPEFPLQGRKITIRHLLTSTSGIIDYHYLGDPLESTYHTPKANDEVIDLFSGKSFTSTEPGIKWDWSISNFALLTEILEKITHASYKDYLQKNVILPLGLKETAYLEEKKIFQNLARGYSKQEGELYPNYQTFFTYDPSLRLSTSTGDLLKIWEAIRTGKLITSESFARMTTPEGAARQMNQADPTLQFGFIIRLKKVGSHPAMGLHGALPGFSSHCYYFPQDDLSIVVLANTANQYANMIGEAIASNMLGLPPAAFQPDKQYEIADLPLSQDEQNMLRGTYSLRLAPDPQRHRSYDYYDRTMRILTEHGQLKIQKLGDSPELLLKQADGSFARHSAPGERLTFEIQDGKATTIRISEGGKSISVCTRIGKDDVKTFHHAGVKRDSK